MKLTKFLLAGLFMTTPVFTAISCSTNIVLISENIENTQDKGRAPRQNYLIKNAFRNNAIELSKDQNNVLVYSISWIAVSHKYAPLVHLLTVLENNPNAEIYLYITNILGNENNYDFTIFEQYTNVKIKIVDSESSQDNLAQYKNGIFFGIKEFLKDINDFDENKIYHLICDDYQFFQPSLLVLPNDEIIKNTYDTFFPILTNFKSVQLIADGTATSNIFSDELYLYFKNNNYLNIDKNEGLYLNAQDILLDLKKMNFEQFSSWSKKNNNLKTFFILLMISNFENKHNSELVKVNMYLPSTDMIKDMNNSYSKKLYKNIKDNIYFDPFYSLNMNFIEMFEQLDSKSFNIFFDFFKIDKIDSSIVDRFKNSYNIVFTGKHLYSDEIVKQQAKILISLYKKHKDKENLKIWFKGHPRENNDILDLLKKEIYRQSKDNADWLYKLNEKIPMEIYLSSKIFINDVVNKKTVKMYSSYSTYVLYLKAANRYDFLEKIMLSNSDYKDIKYTFGIEENSLLFPKSKIEIIN